MLIQLSDVFDAIAAPARRAILDELVERDGQTLFELCARLAMKHEIGLTRQAISQHLEVLETAGLLKSSNGKYRDALRGDRAASRHRSTVAGPRQRRRAPMKMRPEEHLHRRPGQSSGVLHDETRIHQENRLPHGAHALVDRSVAQGGRRA